MKQNNSALLLPFYTSDLPKCKADVEQKIKEMEEKKSKLGSDCKKLHLNHTKLFIHFEQQCLDKQIELLKWLLSD